MATQEATGQLLSSTKNMYKYNTTWGVVYVPKHVAEALTDVGKAPSNVKFTVEAAG
jgi:RNase P/RNase MRP subunit p29